MYDQIRYLSADGEERIRVNYTTNGAYVVEPQNLQNKKNRYYFTESIDLEDGQIYISKLDLNIENGEIEQPLKPMIRIATPIISDSGEHLGVVVANYRAQGLIEIFDIIANAGTDIIYLLNDNGYWLSNSNDESFEWAFMYDDHQDRSFSSLYPEEWQQISSSDSGSINSQNGIFTYLHASIVRDDSSEMIKGEGDWVMVSYISVQAAYDHELLTAFWSNAQRLLREEPFTLVALLLIATISATLVAMRTRKYEHTRHLSEYDGMTEVLNRRTGISLLTKIYKEARRKGKALSICFMDVNGLKEVNDILGHEKGDELLASVVECIQSNKRKSDFLARLGGDEFLLILPECDKIAAEIAWQRIQAFISAINEKNENSYVVSLSHGITQYKFTTNEKIQDVIQAADELMYEEKRRIKQKFKVLK